MVAAYGGTQDVDRAARATTRPCAPGSPASPTCPVSAQMLFGEISDGVGVTYRLGASDALASQVRLTSGRLPDVVHAHPLRGRRAPARRAPRRSTLRSGSSSSGRRCAPTRCCSRARSTPDPDAYVLLSSDPDALQRLEALTRFPRGAGWVGAIDPLRISGLGVPAYAELSRTVADELALEVDTLVLAVPDDVLLREDARAATSQGRFALIGGASAALVLGFVLVAATGLRRDHREAAALLRRRGASRRTRTAFALAGSAIAVLAGLLLGLALGWTRRRTPPPRRSRCTPPPPARRPGRCSTRCRRCSCSPRSRSRSRPRCCSGRPRARATAWHVVEAGRRDRGARGRAARGARRGRRRRRWLATRSPVSSRCCSCSPPRSSQRGSGCRWRRGPAATCPSRAVAARLSAATGVHRPLRTVGHRRLPDRRGGHGRLRRRLPRHPAGRQRRHRGVRRARGRPAHRRRAPAPTRSTWWPPHRCPGVPARCCARSPASATTATTRRRRGAARARAGGARRRAPLGPHGRSAPTRPRSPLLAPPATAARTGIAARRRGLDADASPCARGRAPQTWASTSWRGSAHPTGASDAVPLTLAAARSTGDAARPRRAGRDAARPDAAREPGRRDRARAPGGRGRHLDRAASPGASCSVRRRGRRDAGPAGHHAPADVVADSEEPRDRLPAERRAGRRAPGPRRPPARSRCSPTP